MSDLANVIALLKSKIGNNVYSGEIPETQTAPSVLVANIANPFGRVLSGRKVQKSSTWRITIVAEFQSQVESILDILEEMDNTRTTVFQRVFTSLVLTEFGLNEQPYRRAFYDLTVYK
jgi:hypothetical protein